eukprot:13717530-Ditylum_brightwellii.AAC.1
MEDKMYPNSCYSNKWYCGYKATSAKNNPDTPMHFQASSGDKVKYWFEAVNKEIDNSIKHNTWEVTLQSNIGKKFPF